MKKIPIEREKSDARISSSEREEARPKVKILFLHGFFASGQCQPALALREAFEGRAEVVSPDLPTHVIHFDRKDTKSNRCTRKISTTNYISIISMNTWRFLVDSNDTFSLNLLDFSIFCTDFA